MLRPLTGKIVAYAGELVRSHALRAYDAVHLATALDLRDEARTLEKASQKSGEEVSESDAELETRLMSYDSSLERAARAEGLT
ncbi:Hypothetical Protein RradSPS_3117 (plasmid) [Rubrobacter radiotolerans]|uniref:Uncharacterized protein n=1 Tax=Rubrobacter radiotolerans TaxID=42256 RepID=A0A023X8N9_RUBRA|nr:hypothetical protein [Rubrobacter radiotolerans]AHY48400.1 Hypothetical Protein RradSPS_3117 [Rubrobacter radiotolerans]MDX5895625.1 hypothetical protein [Rubrobacter radiotolerans]